MVVHDIAVNVIPRRLWGEYQEPEMPQFQVSICMPLLKTVTFVFVYLLFINTLFNNVFCN